MGETKLVLKKKEKAIQDSKFPGLSNKNDY